MTYCRPYLLCIVSLITLVILAIPFAFGQSSLTCPIGNAADPTTSNVDAPYLRDPSITSNALCRGACGADCPSDRCRPVDDVRIPRVDDSLNQYYCVYKNVISCPTHQGCRDHDACFDRATEAGEENINGPIHQECNYQCIHNWTIAECVAWSEVIGDLGNPLISEEPFYDGTMLFSDRPYLEGPIGGKFKIDKIEMPSEVVSHGAKGDLKVYWSGTPVFPVKVEFAERIHEPFGFPEKKTFNIRENPLFLPGAFSCNLSEEWVWNPKEIKRSSWRTDFDIVIEDATGNESEYYPASYNCIRSSESYQVKPGAQTPSVIDIGGTWYMGGPFNEGMPCKIIQEGDALTFINENGQESSGNFVESHSVVATDWEKGLHGTLTGDSNRIDWANGTWWIRNAPPKNTNPNAEVKPGTQQTPSVILASAWTVSERGPQGDYDGTWTRRPGTNTFDASWSGGSITDVIDITSVEGNEITLHRHGINGDYIGTIAPDGTSISGTASWYVPGEKWLVSILTQNGQQPPGTTTSSMHGGCNTDPATGKTICVDTINDLYPGGSNQGSSSLL